MTIKIQSDKVQLLELFSSIHYFGAMRDKWEETIQHAEQRLENYMAKLPLNYRARPLPDQPDIVWGHRVLPNFRHTLEKLNEAYIMLTHGDLSALGYANSIRSDFKGQLDYLADWMSDTDRQIYEDNIYAAVTMAHNISITDDAGWRSFELLWHSDELKRISTSFLAKSYRVNSNVFVHSGEKTIVDGIYVPDVENACPQFLNSRNSRSPLASVWIESKDLFDPDTGKKYAQEHVYKDVECTWYLVERSNDNSQSDTKTTQARQLLRVVAGQLCPQTGFYFTPARPNSRKRFIEGEEMPSLNSTYGRTIWQWDEVQ